jgi:trimeric autotransporter adhesin
MANNNATTNVDNITQTTANDTLTFTATNQVNATDVFDGNTGTDGILLSGSNGVAINFTAASVTAFKNYEQLIFGNSSGTTTATFNANQFGATLGNLPFSLQLVATAGTNILVINNASSFSAASFTFSSWTATADQIQINGTTGNDNITGSTQNDLLSGAAGNDTLDGGTGNDTLVGGTGDDNYWVDSTLDVVTENAGEGTDLVYSSVAWTLGNNVENLTLVGASAINGTGNGLNNSITGNAAANTLTGGAGNDTLNGMGGVDILVGGTGDDTYIMNVDADAITENAGEGTDTVQSLVTYTLGANVENLILTGASAINGTGNADANTITGNSAANTLTGGGGNDTLDGGAGNDTLVGGTGNDTYVVDSTSDVITENAGEGTDAVQASATYTLAANIENLTLTGASAINGTGNSGANTIIGNTAANTLTGGAGNDILDGGAGNDTLVGGTDNDTYIVDSASDVITENLNEGTDYVQSSVTYTLANNVENLTLTGGSAVNGTGNALDNILVGNAAANTLSGGAGNDTLDGGAGNDTMAGGAGDDIYVVDSSSDVLTENAGEGTYDRVYASVNYTMGANVEILELTGNAAINGTGNASNNSMYGNSAANSLSGGAGNDTLDGGAGNDTLTGGTGDDIYVVDSTSDAVVEAAGEGTDQVYSLASYTLAANIEYLNLLGSASIDATGNASANIITGNSGNNVIDGGAGIDTMVGGAGDDTYVIDSASDVVIENAGEGSDTVQAAFNYTLAANIENITLIGTSALNATGNTQDNILTGNIANNTLDGGSGDDTLNGGGGDDILIGGLGNDKFVIDSATDTIVENAGGGIDTVYSYVSFTVSGNTENAVLLGSADLNVSGSVDANTLLGNTGNNVIDGGAGNDYMLGDAGNDTYYVDSVSDVVMEDAGKGTDTVQSLVDFTLGSNVENLTLIGSTAIHGTGNDLNNTIVGNARNNVLFGGLGADTMVGSTGDDYYYVDDAGDTIVELAGEGSDTVYSTVTHTMNLFTEIMYLFGSSNINGTGNVLSNTIIGNAGENTLDGAAGADTLIGGLGNDKYVIDSLSDSVVENANEGIDTVYSYMTSTLGANTENLVLVGTSNINATGNADHNTILGNTGDNTLNGGAGYDWMLGGAGNDTYIVDSIYDNVVENAGEGNDIVFSAVTHSLVANVESLTLTGTAAINGAGNNDNNTLTGNSANNELYGYGGDDTLNGGIGNDIMIGGIGNDTYVIDSAGDLAYEIAGEGVDTVMIGSNYTVGANIENVTLTGVATVSATGNEVDNYLKGNAVANTLVGLGGNDTLDGGAGADTMVGGIGDDIYIVDNSADVVTEAIGEGTDTVRSSVNYVLAAGIEYLTLTGTRGINGTGNDSDNIITGNIGSNILNGGAGTDTLIGGAGNDTYVLDSLADTIIEYENEGNDLVQSAVSYTLTNTLEDLTLTGAAAIDGTGNSADNKIVGNGAANTLIGLLGNDTLDGGAGADVMIGGAGNDYYTVDNALDVVTELLDEGADTVYASVDYAMSSNIEDLILTGTAAINGSGNDLNNKITGNAAANVLVGYAGNDWLNGGKGSDQMYGGLGDDVYEVDVATDVVVENAGEGTDLVKSAVTYTLANSLENLQLVGASIINGTGNAGDNEITGNGVSNILYGLAGNDIIDGAGGGDTMYGGTGDDTYYVNITSDIVNEYAGEGTDTILSNSNFTVSANVENLTLIGSGAYTATGNGLDNVLRGNIGNNTIYGMAGNDTIDGYFGVDTMIGGTGDDIYYVDETTDVIVELAGEGTETVYIKDHYTLSANLENLVVSGGANVDGTGNDLNNQMTGNDLDNRLNGATGADTMIGKDGDDVYVIDNVGDVVTELLDEGNDGVESSISYTLTAYVENLTLTGNSAINGTGNAESNYIVANDAINILVGGDGDDTIEAGGGNDTLKGGLGIDFLTGGTGNDTFVFELFTDSSILTDVNGDAYGSDQITDFMTGDKIDLSAIDANSTLAGNQAFVVDTDGIIAAGEIHIFAAVTGVQQLSIHTDADGIADMTLAVVANSLAASDFIL